MEAGNSISLYAVGEFTAFNRFLDVSKSAVMMPMSVGGMFTMVIMRMHAATNSANPAACVGVEVKMPSLVGQLTQFCFKRLWVNAEGDHGSEVHVAADSGRAVVDECRHIR